MKIAISNVCSAFESVTIGTKVLDNKALMDAVATAIGKHDTSQDRAPGQHFIQLPPVCASMVSAGVGRRTVDARDYVLRVHRGRIHAYLQREKALPCSGVAVVVYTRKAYLADPEVSGTERQKMLGDDTTHVIVAILGDSGVPSQLDPYRFTSNLAGGNNEALTWSADEIRAKARHIKEYDDAYCVVAD